MPTISTLVVDVVAKTSGLSTGLKAAAVGVAAVGAVAVKSAVDYDNAFTKISAVSNASAADIEQWRGQVLSLAGETAQAPRELADALYFLSSAGLKSNQIMPVLEASAKGAAAGLGETADVAKLTANVLNAYAGSGIQAADVTDTLVAAVKAGSADTDEFGTALGRILPIASTAGVSFDSVTASLASLSNIGLDVNEGTTAMRGLLQALVSPTQMASDALAGVGLSSQDLLDSLQGDGLIATLRMLEDRIKAQGGTQADFLGTLREIVPNTRSLTGALGLTAQQASKVDSVFEQTANASGSLDEAFNTTAQSAGFKMRQAFTQLQVLAINLGDILLPIVVKVASGLTGLFNILSDHPAVLIAVGTAVVALTAAMVANSIAASIAAEEGVVFAAMTVARTAATIASTAATGAATAAQWLWNAAMTANPIGLVIVAIAALVAGIVLLIRHFHLTDDIMRVLKATVGVVWGFIKAYVGTVIKIVVGYVKLWIAVIGFVIRVVGQLAGVVGRAFSAVYNAVRSWLSRAASFITNTWNGIIRFFGRLGGLLARAGHGMWDWLVGAVRSAANGAIGILNSLINAINSIQFHIHVAGVNVDFNGLGIPNIPTLAQGGMVVKTGLAVVHEGERFSGVGKGWGSTVNVYVQGSVIAEHDLAETVQKVLLRQKKRTGALGLG